MARARRRAAPSRAGTPARSRAGTPDWPWAGALAAVGLALQLVPWPPAWVDATFMTRWLPLWSRLTAPLVDSLQTSLSLALLGAWLTAMALAAAWALAAPRPTGDGRPAASRPAASPPPAPRGPADTTGRPGPWRLLLRLASWPAALLVFAFPLAFGLAYRASSLEAALATGPGQAGGVEEATAVRLWVTGLLAEAAGSGSEGRDWATVQAAASSCVARTSMAVRHAYLPSTVAEVAVPGRVKPLPAGTLLRIGYAGVVSPWLLEPHYDPGLPRPAALGVALHELAHTAGFAREAEAEAVGLVAGLTCADEDVRYAAALGLATRLLAALPEAQAAAFLASWPEHARADARAAELAAERYRVGPLQRAADALYSTYLRAQGGEEGLGEYDEGTRLALELLARQGVLSPLPGGDQPHPQR